MNTSTDEIINIPLHISFKSLAQIREIFNAVYDEEIRRNLLPLTERGRVLGNITAVLNQFDQVVFDNPVLTDIFAVLKQHPERQLPLEIIDSFSDEHDIVFTLTVPETTFMIELLTGYYQTCTAVPLDHDDAIEIQVVMTNILDFLQQIIDYVRSI